METTPITRTRGHTTILGVILILLGIIALLTPGFAGLSVAWILGLLVMAGGIARMWWGYEATGFGKRLLLLVLGVLMLLCGIALLANPLFASSVLTILLAVYFLVDGVMEIIAGVEARPVPGWGWLIFGGIVSLLLGAMLWSQFPLSGAWATGILLGIKLFLVGLIVIAAGSAMRSMARTA